MLLNIFTNFDKQKNYQKQPKFNGVYSRNDSAKIKDEAYVINLPTRQQDVVATS